jgi:hypothetical protein
MRTTENLQTPAEQAGVIADGAARADSRDLPGVMAEIERDLREHGDLLEFQRRCEALEQALANDAEGLRALRWVTCQAELIDCMLIPGSRESVADALHELSVRLAQPPRL